MRSKTEVINDLEIELEGLLNRYDLLKEQGLPEDHPKVQFASMTFIRKLKEYEQAYQAV